MKVLVYFDRECTFSELKMSCGIPQESVFGPLWNVTYDVILRREFPEECSTLCYADDTLIVAEDSNISEAAYCVELCATLVVKDIERLGLKISSSKTEATAFFSGVVPAALPCVNVGGTNV